MTVAAPESTRAGSGARPGIPRRLVAALAVTQTVAYGVLYYAFSALLGPMSRDLGISTATAAGALTTAVLVTGLMSVPVGRWLDARGGHALMTTGSLLGVAAVVGWSQVQTTVQLYGVFVAIGIASAMVLYEPAFAVVVAVTEPASRTRALLGITLVAGFSSSIFIPLTGQNGLFSIAMIAILTGLGGFVLLNAGRLPCGGVVGGVDSAVEDCFVRVSWAVVHPASKAPVATAATAKVIALFTENSLSNGMPAAE